ncbi:uncharacterized protein LOC110735585 [Chenopodium quinoa]|uniref:uncharacterized protein LOC110735585 n=1 Tax=Chenopodium quinoa TaxID=63459 RepID=UPI000B78390B|nr:uncharacterized protein LOC110735585 [Chenopodium quinoa]
MADDLANRYEKLNLNEKEVAVVDVSEVASTEQEEKLSLMLVGRLLRDRGVNFEAFKRTITQSWAMKGRVVIRSTGNNLYVFQFFHWRDKEKVMDGRPWCFEQNLLLLNSIKGDEQPTDVILTHSPFWVRLENLPFNCQSNEHVRAIASTLGEVMEIEDETLSICKNRRVKVELDVREPLRRIQSIKTKEGNIARINLKYERLPFFFFLCGRMGHSEKDCITAHEEAETNGFGWGLWLKASPMKGRRMEGEEMKELNSGKKLNFVVKETIDSGHKVVNPVTGEQFSGGPLHYLTSNVGDQDGVEGIDRMVGVEEGGDVEPLGKGSMLSEVQQGVGGALKWSEILAGAELNTGLGEGAMGNKIGMAVLFNMGTVGEQQKVVGGKRERVRRKCGFTEGVEVSSSGRAGGLALWWRDIMVNMISFSQNHIAVDVVGTDNNPVWRAIGVYGWPEKEHKHKTWSLLKNLYNSYEYPVVFFGDFNEILTEDEKVGGVPRAERCMDGFREAMDSMGVRDLGFKGCKFTWQRGLSVSNLVRERLDRGLASGGWCTLFPGASVINSPIVVKLFDHGPIVIKVDGSTDGGRDKKLFIFEKHWLSRTECEGVVKDYWSSAYNDPIQTKIAGCAAALSSWAGKTFGDIKKRKRKAEEELKEIQKGVMDDVGLSRCKRLSEKLAELRLMEESYWYSRARAWTSDGEEALKGLSCMITKEMNQTLCTVPTSEEISKALFEMHPNKAPGIDGLHALFYQKFWHIVGNDIINFIIDWWYYELDISDIGKTCIVLIPKCHDPRKITEYRPINLCNVVYKIISKMLANRLKPLLKNIISPQQSAFVPGRLITDNALVAFEIFHYMKRRGDGRHGTIALKLDMMKAYDRVEWSFLEKVMQRLGFCEFWVQKLMRCLSCYSFQIKANGEIFGNITPTRGLRQGDPISPYLFLFVADAFSRFLSYSADEGLIHGVKVCHGAPRISHLFFADDSILFSRANTNECSKIANILTTFESASGQKLNLSKSEVSFSKNVMLDKRKDICELLGVGEVEKHEKYLGIPTIIGKSKKIIFASL